MIPLFFLFLACKEPPEEEEPSEYTIDGDVLAGVIGGEDWTFVAGETNAFLSDEDGFFASLYAEDFEPCGFDTPSGADHLILNLATEPADEDLSFSNNMTFVVQEEDGTENLIGTEGRVVVEEVTETTVSGGITAIYDDNNEVSGTFTVTICPDE